LKGTKVKGKNECCFLMGAKKNKRDFEWREKHPYLCNVWPWAAGICAINPRPPPQPFIRPQMMHYSVYAWELGQSTKKIDPSHQPNED
jgi:hypothetical protein